MKKVRSLLNLQIIVTFEKLGNYSEAKTAFENSAKLSKGLNPEIFWRTHNAALVRLWSALRRNLLKPSATMDKPSIILNNFVPGWPRDHTDSRLCSTNYLYMTSWLRSSNTIQFRIYDRHGVIKIPEQYHNHLDKELTVSLLIPEAEIPKERLFESIKKHSFQLPKDYRFDRKELHER